MKNELTLFEGALATLEKDWPPGFTLEVEDHVFRDVGSITKAREIAAKMEAMKERAHALGYKIETFPDPGRRLWLYMFVRRPGAVRPEPKRVKAVALTDRERESAY